MNRFHLCPLTITLVLQAGVTLCLAQDIFDAPSIRQSFGYTEPYRIARMSFPETGVISTIPAKEGDQVRDGDLLARLDVEVLRHDLEIVRREVDLQSSRLAKMEELAEQGRISPDEMDRARTDHEVSRLRAQRSEAQIESRTLRAPFDGIITEIKKQVAESVSPSTHILTIVQLDRLTVNLHLAHDEASRLRRGSPVTLILEPTQQTVAARVEFVSPVVDAASGTVRVKFLIPNDGLRIPSGARARLRAEERAPLFDPATTDGFPAG